MPPGVPRGVPRGGEVFVDEEEWIPKNLLRDGRCRSFDELPCWIKFFRCCFYDKGVFIWLKYNLSHLGQYKINLKCFIIGNPYHNITICILFYLQVKLHSSQPRTPTCLVKL